GPLLLSGNKLDGKGLDDGYQSHVGVSGHRDGTHVVGTQSLRYQDGGRAVGRTDDADGGGIFELKAHESGDDDGQENTGLGSGAAQKQLGIGQQRTEVDHGTDADKQQNGHGFAGLNPHLEKPLN